MSKRWIYLGAVAVTVFLVALLLRTPSGWILWGASRMLPVEVRWTDARGTISATVVNGLSFALPGGRRAYFDKVILYPALASLLSGRLGLNFEVDDGGERLEGSADFGLHGWRLTDIDGSLSSDALIPTLPELEIAGLEGRITIQADNIAAEYGSLPSSGLLLVRLEGIRTIWLQTEQPLGSYEMEMQAQEQSGISGELRTLSPAALLSVTGRIIQEPASQTLNFTGQGQLSADAPVPLRRVLPILGRAGKDRVTMAWQLALD